MATFPSPLERTVASALLLLSSQPSKLMIECCDGETKGKAGILISSTESESCSSSPFHQLSSRKQQKLRITTVWLPAMRSSSRFRCSYSDPPLFAAFCLFFVSFVIKKRRSRTGAPMAGIYPSGHSSNMEKAETTSCLSSSSSSGISSARSQRKTNKAEKIQRKRRSSGSNHMRRRAEAILKLLSGGCFSEVNIRRVLGDSPDTSKALRMLLKQEEVKRSGTGGQKDPYIYTFIAHVVCCRLHEKQLPGR
ncbi:uncharacterized protein LOC120173153 [Hibiscus syriacus]|uniref:uncharacterized protein LOC120173153 n=1 Tax=Hibiscus syriacus TaxID=106335 RepID=UPI0019241C42|nr:uncharacterized protein LOC120173153 [Hibiscus syriacus]